MIYQKGSDFRTLVAFDLGARRELWSVTASRDLAYFIATIAGHRLVVATPSAVTVFSFDGKQPKELMRLTNDWESVQDVAASPDGETLAIVVNSGPVIAATPPGPDGQSRQLRSSLDSAVFYDLSQDREVGRIESTRPEFAGFDGRFGPVIWRDDGAGVFLWGATSSDRPGGYASLFLDGKIIIHDLEGAAYVAPNARLAVEGASSLGCLAYSGHSVVVEDLETGQDLVTVKSDARAFTGVDWSPDSREFLFESRPYYDSPDCSWFRLVPQLFLISLPGGQVEPVTDLEAVYRRWYGESLIWLDCQSQFSVPRPHPFGNFTSLRCTNIRGMGTLHVSGQEIDSSELFHVVGIIE